MLYKQRFQIINVNFMKITQYTHTHTYIQIINNCE